MKKLIILVIILSPIIVFTQQNNYCLNEETYFTITEQSFIDNFPINYPNCKRIYTNLVIQGNVTNFEGFNQVTHIDGMLVFGCDSMENLSGLDNVIYMKSLLIHQNDRFKSLHGLENLTYINGELQILGNDSLTDLTGLNLNYVGERILIGENRMLNNLNGLDNLTSIAGYLLIRDNESLIDLTALNSLKSINGAIAIFQNKSLSSLKGLDNINPNSISNIAIMDNESLSQCEVKSICEFISSNDKYVIRNNKQGCDTVSEVIDACNHLDIHENSIDDIIEIYPNPSHGSISIKSEKKILSATVYNQYGNKVLVNENITSSMNLSGLSDGFYFVEFKTENNLKYRRKIILTKL